MGATDLLLVSPECEIDSQKARQGAAGSQNHLSNAKVYDSFKQLKTKNPEGIFIAMTARQGKSRPTKPLPLLLDELIESQGKGKISETPVYIVLGPEDDGLDTESIEMCQYAASLPIYGEFKSLNLGHAAQLSLYITQEKLLGLKEINNPMEEANAAVSIDPSPLITRWLEELGFNLTAPKVNAGKVISNMLQKALPNKKEWEIFDKVVNQSIRRLKEGKHE